MLLICLDSRSLGFVFEGRMLGTGYIRFITIDGGGDGDDGLKFSTRGGVRRSRLARKQSAIDAYNGLKKRGGGLKFIYVQEIARVANAGPALSSMNLHDGRPCSTCTSCKHTLPDMNGFQLIV